MPQLVRVKIVAEVNKSMTIVDYIGQKYVVKPENLNNHITQSTSEGFITYAYVNSVFLTKKWR